MQNNWLAARSEDPTTPWDTAVGRTTAAWRAGDTTWIVVQAVWNEGCGQNGGLTVTYQLTGAGLVPVHEADDRFEVELLLDLDGDGQLEMLGRSEEGGRALRRFWGSTGAASDPGGDLRTFSVPYHHCRC